MERNDLYMKRNTALLADQVRNKLTNKCLTAIVAEAYVNSLPFDKFEVIMEAGNFAEYVSGVVSKMHPEKMLDEALESTKNNGPANRFVRNLKASIDSIAKEATDRIVLESKDTDMTNPEIVEQAKLDKKETEKLVKASKSAGTSAVSKIVKDNMINVIKDEKTAYEEEAKVKEEVKDMIKSQKDELLAARSDIEGPITSDADMMDSANDTGAEPDKPVDNDESLEVDENAFESYARVVLAPTDARNHISLFSRLQDICIEAITHSNEVYDGEVPFKTMEKITLESTFDYFDLKARSMKEELDSLTTIANEAAGEDCPEGVSKEEAIKTSFICTICIMTLFEVLKTMHLKKPTVEEVRKIVDAKTDITKLSNVSLKNVEDKVNEIVATANKSVAMGAFAVAEAEEAKESLVNVKNIIGEINVSNDEIQRKSRILSKIDTAIEAIVVSDNVGLKGPVKGYTERSAFEMRMYEENRCNLMTAVNRLIAKPMVREVRIEVNSADRCSENANIEVVFIGVDASGMKVNYDYQTFHAVSVTGNNVETVAELIKQSAEGCDFSKPVLIYFIDKGYTVPLY